MTMNFEQILQKAYPDGHDCTFATISHQEYSELPGDSEPVLRTIQIPDRFTYSAIIWNNTPVLTEQECIDIWAIITNEQTIDAVHEKRISEYPGWQEFAEAMWNAMDSGLLPKVEPWFTECATVKANNPLP